MRIEIQWNRRPKREHTKSGYKRTWHSKCGRYRVDEITPLGGLSRCYYAMFLEEGEGYRLWTFVDLAHRRYRTQKAAMRACLKHARQEALLQ